MEAAYTVPAYLGLICIPILTLTDIQDGVARARGLIALGLLPPYVLRPLLLIVGLGAAHLCGLAVNAHIAIAAAIGVGRYRRTPSSCGQEGCCAGLE